MFNTASFLEQVNIKLKVTIYIPTKNRLALLQLAINSVLNQTYKDIELIVVNDASTDGTHAYLEALSQADSRVKYLRNEKSLGAPAARNLAIKQAAGYFVTGLDDDDEFEPYHIEALVNYWQLLEKASQQFSAIYVQDKLRNNNKISYLNKLSSVSAKDMLIANSIGNQIFTTKDRYLGAGLFNEKMPAWQDLEFYYRIVKKYGNARLLDIHSYIFDVTPRADRISKTQKNKIIAAFHQMVADNNISKVSDKHNLLFQAYKEYYGFKVTLSDVMLVLETGWRLKAFLKILRKWINLI